MIRIPDYKSGMAGWDSAKYNEACKVNTYLVIARVDFSSPEAISLPLNCNSEIASVIADEESENEPRNDDINEMLCDTWSLSQPRTTTLYSLNPIAVEILFALLTLRLPKKSGQVRSV
ncbi:hypothetical protein [Pedobacter frigiditerrae]|uniref:hypothetical protein n=1 Tax=Pedobacter frigiditerrae TaxID=2530452 RepID=UPI002931C04F|nr:hypothetical protein [Pedobacter frigiditerrae]